MSGTLDIEQALLNELMAITPMLSTAFTNAPFTTISGAPYQRVDFLYSKPTDYISGGFTQRGYMQIRLSYPELFGVKESRTRAELIRTRFKAGSIFSGVHITATSEIAAGDNQEGRYVVPVFVYFSKIIKEA